MKLTSEKIKLLKFLFLGLLLSGCSGDDLAEDDNYFSAEIEGEQLLVNEYSGNMKSEKRISDFGTVDFLVKVESEEGRSIEFLIHNYTGIRTYSIGEGYYNDSWIRYSQIEPAGSWNASKAPANTSAYYNSIDITEDTGEIIRGQFTFQGRDSASGTMKTVTEGDFNLKY